MASLNDDTEMIVTGKTRHALNFADKRGWLIVAGVVLSVALNVGLVTTVGVISHGKSQHKHTPCDSASCVETAAAVASSLNESHPACSDFYEYACGGYKLYHTADEENSMSSGVWNQLVDTFNKRLWSAIESSDQSQKYAREVTALFHSCMDLDALDAEHSKPLLDLINQGDGLQFPTLAGMDWKRETFDMALWIKTLHQMNINSLFTLTKGLNPLKPNVVALKVFPSGLNMNKWDYSDHSSSQQRQEDYRNRMTDYILNLGVTSNRTLVANDVSDVFNFEQELSKILPDYRHEVYSPTQLRLKQLYRDFLPITSFDWKSYVAALFPSKQTPDPFTPVFIENWEYFADLSKLISHTNERTLANFLGMSLLYDLADHLPQHVSGQISAHRRYNTEESPLYVQCASLAEKLMPWASVRSMLDKNLLATKTTAMNVFNNLKTELMGALDAVSDQFSESFAKQLINKAENLHGKIGYPDWVLNKTQVNEYYSKMEAELNATKYLKNVMIMSKFRKLNVLMSTEEQYEDGEGWDLVFGDAATYILHGNDIFIPSSYMAAPVYAHDMPDSFNYGGLGAWLGYYMVYAIEDDWAQYSDDDGNIIAFNATTVDKAAFQTVKDCYNYLENATYLSPGQSEPIPVKASRWGLEYQHNDIIATKIAYKAFHKYKKGGQTAPALPDNTDQIFFLALGQFYCQTEYSPDSYYHKLLNSIAVSRPEFSQAFGCQADDYLYNAGTTTCYL